MREDAVLIVQVDDVDDPNGRMPPPIWVVVVVVAVVTGGWLLATQGSTDTDPVTNPTLLPATPDEASVVTPTVAPDEASVVTPTVASLGAVSVFGNPPIAITAETPQQLAGYVAVTSPDDPPFNQSNVWVFRPGGSLVSRSDNIIGRGNAEYPMLITAGHLILGGRISDIDLAEPPISLWTNGSVVPGSGPGVVWLTQRVERIQGDSLWISPVDVESLTVGERIDITDLFSRPIAGVVDGLIVLDYKWERYVGRYAYWSPTDGLVPLDLFGEVDTGRRVVAASGDLVVVASAAGRVRYLDIVSGEYVFSFDLVDIVTSACLSPDGQHVIVIGRNGKAVVGNTTTGEVLDLNEVTPDHAGVSVQQENGIGWTTDDQLVFIAGNEDSKHLFGLDVRTGESFLVATLDGPDWRLAASGTMC